MSLWAVVPVKERVSAKERLAPILRPEVRQALALAMLKDVLAAITAAPVIAVSPIIGGKAVKGPTAKMMAELGLPVDAAAVAWHYGDILDHYVADETDANEIGDLGVPVTLTRTLMVSLEDREALARVVLEAAGRGF